MSYVKNFPSKNSLELMNSNGLFEVTGVHEKVKTIRSSLGLALVRAECFERSLAAARECSRGVSALRAFVTFGINFAF